jgi:signal transduction histidine kinase
LKRKYIGPRRDLSKVKENTDDESDLPNIENLDPLDVQQRQFDLLPETLKNHLSSVESSSNEIIDTKNEFDETKAFFNESRTNLENQLERIDRIKKLHQNFEHDLSILNSHTISQIEEKYDKTDTQESETFTAAKDIISLIDISNKQKLKVMGLQLENEKKQSEKLTNFIKDHMKKIIEVDENLRKELGHEVSSLVENNAKQKIKVMELQFETEQKQSSQLNKQIQDQIKKIEEYDDTIRKQCNQLQTEVREKTKKLLKAERLSAIGELAARVAHDLRNPLSVIKASVELMKIRNQKESDEFIVRQLGLIERGVSRMSHQIEDVLDFVRPIPLLLSKNSILKTVNSSIEKANLSKKVTIILPENDIEFLFDKDKIDVAIDNLITNAKQAMKNNGKIVLSISESGDEVQIKIQDSGPGIPEEVLPRIFEPLVTTKQTGTGLGLASVKSIIKQHHGTISVKNNPTTFTIKLPKGLCHKCLTSNVELVIHKGQILCKTCFDETNAKN